VKRSALVATALVAGLLGAMLVLLGYLAFLASVEEVYLHGWQELVGWRSLPALLAPVVAVQAAWRHEPHRFGRQLAMLGVGALSGALVGGALGALLASHPSGPWAGGLMGAGAGTLLGMLPMVVPTSWLQAVPALALVLVVSACRPSPDPAPSRVVSQPLQDSSGVESVVFFLGDPGEALMESHPVLPRLRRDVEAWARHLGGDGSVRVALLGDLVYPDGMGPPGSEGRATDSLRLASQIALVEGPEALAHDARALFLPGNHDWGQEEGHRGEERLQNIEDFLGSWSGPARGRVGLVPDAGRGGPVVVDLGDELRLVILDTAWWLLGREPSETESMLRSVRRALESAGSRRVVVAAHHPLESGGPHGAGVDLGSLFGIRWLLKKAGILLQDLDSRPYSGLKTGLLEVFREAGRPALFIGGHEHSLQVFEGGISSAARAVVVGSGSKLTGLSAVSGMLFGRSEPGYAVLVSRENGDLQLILKSAPDRFLRCPEDGRETCMQQGDAAFRTVWSETLPDREATRVR